MGFRFYYTIYSNSIQFNFIQFNPINPIGDIHATNTGERFYSTLTMLLGAMMFGAIISKVKELIASRDLLSKDVKSKEEEFKSYLDDRKIPITLRSIAKVRKKIKKIRNRNKNKVVSS